MLDAGWTDANAHSMHRLGISTMVTTDDLRFNDMRSKICEDDHPAWRMLCVATGDQSIRRLPRQPHHPSNARPCRRHIIPISLIIVDLARAPCNHCTMP